MNFLAPLFFLGALAIAGPIIFHLIRRTTREKTPFSTLMFLQPTPPRITRRSRLENLWLLLLRCLVIALLATSFARPFFRDKLPSPEHASERHRTVILVDTSASMRRPGAWDEARKAASTQLQKGTIGDEFAVLAFDRGVRPVVTFADWNGLEPSERVAVAEQRISELAPTWAGTQLDTALIHAADWLNDQPETTAARRQVFVISDLQEGARLDGMQGFEWTHGITVEFITVKAEATQNASLQWLADASEASSPAKDDAAIRVRVTNAEGDPKEQFIVRWKTADVQSNQPKVDAYVPAGQSRIVRPTAPPNAQAIALTLEGDGVDFDNTTYLLPEQAVRIPVLFLGTESPTDSKQSLYYLLRAFPNTRTQKIEIIAAGAEAPPDFQLQQAQMVILGEGASDAAIDTARRAAESGRVVFAPLPSASSAASLARLLANTNLPVTEAEGRDYALFGEIDFQHPLFAPFADPRFSDFSKIHIWKHRRLDPAAIPNARVVGKFDRGDAAIIQVPVGRGSVVIFTTSWRPIDSQLALSTKFVPLLHSLLEQSSDLPATRTQYVVGDEFALPSGPVPLRIRKPDGSEVTAEAGSKFTTTDLPGVYQVEPGNLRFVVNLAPDESRLAPITPDRFHSLGIPMQPTVEEEPIKAAERAAVAQATELESRQKLWRWLIAGAVGLLLLETLIAGKLSGPVRSSTAMP